MIVIHEHVVVSILNWGFPKPVEIIGWLFIIPCVEIHGMKSGPAVTFRFWWTASLSIFHSLVQVKLCAVKLIVELVEIAQLPKRFRPVGIIVAKAFRGGLQQRNNLFFVGIVAQASCNMILRMSRCQRVVGQKSVMLCILEKPQGFHLVAWIQLDTGALQCIAPITPRIMRHRMAGGHSQAKQQEPYYKGVTNHRRKNKNYSQYGSLPIEKAKPLPRSSLGDGRYLARWWKHYFSIDVRLLFDCYSIVIRFLSNNNRTSFEHVSKNNRMFLLSLSNEHPA